MTSFQSGYRPTAALWPAVSTGCVRRGWNVETGRLGSGDVCALPWLPMAVHAQCGTRHEGGVANGQDGWGVTPVGRRAVSG